MSIERIAIEVGYTNANTFTRVFKKNEGMTPGEFRRISKIHLNEEIS